MRLIATLLACVLSSSASAGWVTLTDDGLTAGATQVRSGCAAPGQYERPTVPLARSVTINGLPDSGRCYFALNAGPQDEWTADFTALAFGRAVPGVVGNLAVTWTPSPPQPAGLARRGGSFLELNPGTSGTIAWPAGVVAGDFAALLCSWYELGVDAQPNTPAGFSALTASTAIGDSGASESRAQVFSQLVNGPRSGTIAITLTARGYANCVLDVYAAPGGIVAAAATIGTPANGTTVTAPSAAAAGQYLLTGYALTDPATQTTPAGMLAGQVGGQLTNTGRWFYAAAPITGPTGAKSSTLGTPRGNIGYTVLLRSAP